MKLHYRSGLKRIARNLRAAGNLAEALLWKELKAKKLGVQFLRQRPLGNYIVDFYCHSSNLAIEIDGISHDGKIEADAARQKSIESLGVYMVRFLDCEVRQNLDAVLHEIKGEILRLGKIPPKQPPLRKVEYSALPLANPSPHQNEVLPLGKGE